MSILFFNVNYEARRINWCLIKNNSLQIDQTWENKKHMQIYFSLS